LLFWMEVMSVLGKAHEMFGILTRALAWPGLKVCPPPKLFIAIHV